MNQPLEMAAHNDDVPESPRSCRDCAHASSNRKYDPFRECDVRDFYCFSERNMNFSGCGSTAKWFVLAPPPKPNFSIQWQRLWHLFIAIASLALLGVVVAMIVR